MKTPYSFDQSLFCLRPKFALAILLGLLCFGNLTARGADAFKLQPNPGIGAGDVIVHGKFGGNIFGFEVDPNGTEGLLCEAVGNPDGTVTATVETFSQATGRIIRVLRKTDTQDDFIAWTVAGSVGLFEHEKVKGLFESGGPFIPLTRLPAIRLTGAGRRRSTVNRSSTR